MLPTYCPSCQAQLKVKCLKCSFAKLKSMVPYNLPLLALLSETTSNFYSFMINDRKFEKMASELKLKLSHCKNMLNEIIKKLKQMKSKNSSN